MIDIYEEDSPPQGPSGHGGAEGFSDGKFRGGISIASVAKGIESYG